MKGLLRKDLYMAVRYGRMLLVISAVFLAVSVLAPENLFFAGYPVLFGGILPITLLSYDERFGWPETCSVLPVTRRDIVSERYLLSLLGFLFLYLLTLLAQGTAGLARGDLAAVKTFACLLPMIGLIPPAILLPIMLRWGVEKGRIVYYVIIGVVMGVFIFLTRGAETEAAVQAAMPSPGLAGAALSAVLLGLSWLLAFRLYETREI